MEPYNQPGRQPEQSMQGQSPMQGQSQPTGMPAEGGRPISEMTVSTPTLQWVSIDHPQTQIPLGPGDYVLDSVYNHQMGAWEVLVLVQPSEDDEDEEDDE